MLEEIKDNIEDMSPASRAGLAQYLVSRFLEDDDFPDKDADWEGFVRILGKVTVFTRKDLEDARKFITEDEDDSRTDKDREEDIPEDRQKDPGDPDGEGNDPA